MEWTYLYFRYFPMQIRIIAPEKYKCLELKVKSIYLLKRLTRFHSNYLLGLMRFLLSISTFMQMGTSDI